MADCERSKNESDVSSIFFTCIEEQKLLKELVGRNEPIDFNTIRPRDGLSLLHLAIFNNQYENCLWLLDHGSDINQFTGEIGRSIETPLQIAASIDVSCELFTLIIDKGADVNLRTPDHGFTALHKVTKGRQDIHGQKLKLSILLKNKANPLICSIHGMSPISHFLPNLNQADHVNIAKEMLHTLVQYGIDIDLQDVYGNTALLNACTFGNEHIIKLLVELGANVLLTRRDGYTLLHELCLWERFKFKDKAILQECIQLLIAQGLDINTKAINGQQPLHVVCEAGESTKTLDLLIDLGADVHAKDSWGKLPVHDCTNEFLTIFIEHGIDVNSQDINGHSLLMSAVMEEKKDSVQTLLLANALPNLHDKCGRTALHFLTGKSESSFEVLRNLLENGGDLKAKDKYGKTPLDYYEYLDRGNTSKLQLLLASKGFQIPQTNKMWKKYSDVKARLAKYFQVPVGSENDFDEEKKPLYDSDLLHDALDIPGIGAVDLIPCYKTVGEHVEVLVARIAKHISNRDSNFNFAPRISGSVNEGTKIGFPNEFDYLLYVKGMEEFFEIAESGDTEDGYASLKIKNDINCPVKYLTDDNGYFLSPRFTAEFYELVFNAMSTKEVWQNIDLYWVFKRTFDLRQSNLYIELKSPLANFPDIEISIDLVPVLQIPKWRPKKSINMVSLPVHTEGNFCLVLMKFFAKSNIPVVRYPKFSQVRVSASEIEASIITGLPKVLKLSYIFLKAIRRLCIFESKYTGNPGNSASARVPTYTIKNSLFYHAVETTENLSCEDKVIYKHAVAMLCRILNGAMIGKFAWFFIPTMLLINDHDEYEREKVGVTINQLIWKLLPSIQQANSNSHAGTG